MTFKQKMQTIRADLRHNENIRPEHGGGLNQAAQKYAIEASQWLDLSTGINANGWPVPELPADIFNRLPEADDGLLPAAQQYYQTRNILPVAGSQQAIQLLPFVLKKLGLISDKPRVGLLSPAYSEHEFSWQMDNAQIIYLDRTSISDTITGLDVLVIINPNNPDGYLSSPETLQLWQRQLRKQGGLLIVDEAFMDCTAQSSLLSVMDFNQIDNLIILRSIGKFFGLAGIRCGFIMAHKTILDTMEYYQGPWSVNNPARYIVRHALTDQQWIEQTRRQLVDDSVYLQELLSAFLIDFDPDARISGSCLFKTIVSHRAAELHKCLAQQGILSRLLDDKSGIRFGLPANKTQYQRLKKSLKIILPA